MPSNTRCVYPLESDLHDAFSHELADELDKLIVGFHFEWNLGNGCFTVRESDKLHSRIAMEIYLGETRLLITHFSFPNPDGGAQKCQTDGCYDLANPSTTPESVAVVIADMLDRTLPYHRAIDTHNDKEEDTKSDSTD